MNISDNIITKLGETEENYRVKIPIAIESGSRAWGFASPDSDYDCRFIYVRRMDDYITVFQNKDTISYVPNKIFDLDGWDLKKVIQHIVKSNAVMFEWLSSEVTYKMDEEVHAKLWKLCEIFFNPISVSWHYLSMAKGKYHEILESDSAKIKKYCYVLRPLACLKYIRMFGKIPFMEYRKNLDKIDVNCEIMGIIDELLKQKQAANESQVIGENEILLRYFEEEIAISEKWLDGRKFDKCNKYDLADETFREIIGMVNK